MLPFKFSAPDSRRLSIFYCEVCLFAIKITCRTDLVAEAGALTFLVNIKRAVLGNCCNTADTHRCEHACDSMFSYFPGPRREMEIQRRKLGRRKAEYE